MKKFLTVFLLCVSSAAFAHGYHGGYGPYRHYGGYHYNYNYNWVAPALIGGALAYSIAREPVYVSPPVYMQPQPVITQPVIVNGQNCGPWTEIRNADGTISQQRICQ